MLENAMIVTRTHRRSRTVRYPARRSCNARARRDVAALGGGYPAQQRALTRNAAESSEKAGGGPVVVSDVLIASSAARDVASGPEPSPISPE